MVRGGSPCREAMLAEAAQETQVAGMDRVRLGGEDGIEVSGVCLGTMTFGNQTDADDAFAQMDRALETGITFLDTAEMYPVNPVRAATVGRTEEIIGDWITARRNRDRVEIATKVSGPEGEIRGGEGFDGPGLATRVDESLARLKTDVIDLYQLHVPMRPTYHFRKIWDFQPPARRDETLAHMDEVAQAMAAVVRAGKVRAFGLSNETAWGTARWIDAAARHGLPLSSIQNEYSPLNRLFDGDLAELAVNEAVTLLAFSPLAAGLLTGKYAGGQLPEGSRAAVNRSHGGPGDLGGRHTPRADAAVAAWHTLAARHDLDPLHLAIAFTRHRPFPVIPIIGATTVAQLDHLLDGIDLALDEAVLNDIAALNKAHPLPY